MLETYPKLNDRSIKARSIENKDSVCHQLCFEHADTKYDFLPVNLGDSVNTIHSEYYPSVTVTDSLLVYTRKYPQEKTYRKPHK